MNGIECIEVWLRTVVTCELAHRCGPSGYLKKPSFNQGFDHKQFRKTLRQEHERSEVKAGFRPALSEQVHRREPSSGLDGNGSAHFRYSFSALLRTALKF